MISAARPHRYEVRVYYEDTDLAGIVYYANYLKFIERARSEMLRAAGIDQARFKAEQGAVFVVRRLEIDYRAPARFDDVLAVETTPLKIGGARLTLKQDVLRPKVDAAPTLLTSAVVEIAVINEFGAPQRLPAEAREALNRAAVPAD